MIRDDRKYKRVLFPLSEGFTSSIVLTENVPVKYQQQKKKRSMQIDCSGCSYITIEKQKTQGIDPPQINKHIMYYDRKISDPFSALIENGGDLRWLFHFAKKRNDLDFLTGKNDAKEWISVYRGLSRILTIMKTSDPAVIMIDGANVYKKISPALYGEKPTSFNFRTELENLLNTVAGDSRFDRYYNNKKEGYYQNILSRRYGILGNKDDDFVIVDKEVVVGYRDQKEKDLVFNCFRPKYKKLLQNISAKDSKRYGKHNERKAVGNELDFLALDKNGNVLLIEYKHGTNTSGIYLSPVQIGMYYDIFSVLPEEYLEDKVLGMVKQKQKTGLICPDWHIPKKINTIIPVLIISEYNGRSSAGKKFNEILTFSRKQLGPDFLKNLLIYDYTEREGLKKMVL